MRYRAGFILFWLCILFPNSLLANKIYFPELVFGGGFATDLTVVNTGIEPVSAQVVFFDQDGTPRPDLAKSLVVVAGARAGFTLTDIGPLTVAWAELDAGTGLVEGVATISVRSNGLLRTVGLHGTSSGNRFVVPVDVTETGSTAVAIANLDDSFAISVDLRLFSESGVEFALATDPRLFLMPARDQVAAFVHDLFPQLSGATFKGTLVIKSPGDDSSITATALSVREGILSPLPVVPGDGTRGTGRHFPLVVVGGGYETTFVVMNMGTTPASGSLRFYSRRSGDERTDLTREFNVPVDGSIRLAISDSGPMAIVWGELDSSPSVQSLGTIDFRDGSGALTTAASLLGVHVNASFVIPVDADSGVAIANLREFSEGVTLRLLATDGTEIATNDLLSSMRQRSQATLFVSKLFPQVEGTSFNGTLVIEQTSREADAVVSRVSNGIGEGLPTLAVTAFAGTPGIFSSLPVIPGSGVTGGGPASECLGVSLYNDATTLHLEYSPSFTHAASRRVDDLVFSPNVTWKGNSVSAWRGTRVAIGLATITTTIADYFRVEGLELVKFGSTRDQPIGPTEWIYTPPFRDRRYTLVAGESVRQTSTLVRTEERRAVPPITTTTSSQTTVVRYLGQENVTVGPGTFEDACKFHSGLWGARGRTWWEAKGTGIVLKSITFGFLIEELKSGTINGSPIVP